MIPVVEFEQLNWFLKFIFILGFATFITIVVVVGTLLGNRLSKLIF